MTLTVFKNTFASVLPSGKNQVKYIIPVIAIGIIYLFFAGKNSGGNAPDSPQWSKPFQVPEKMDFCGERVPLEDPEVYERVDKELLGNAFWQSSNLMHLKRMARYFPEIEMILKKNGLPDDIKFLAVAESGLAGVVSPVGAAGFWQFMPQTGKQYGLEISDEIDERYHLIKSTEAACKYLKDMNQIFGSWTLSAAAYNCGVGGIQKSLSFQNVNSYYDLFLNTETSRYIFRILVLKEILSNPGKYHYMVPPGMEYKPLQTVLVNVSGTVSNWARWAMEHGITYKTLRYLNPWIKKHTLTNQQGKTYQVELPIRRESIKIDEKYSERLEIQSQDTASQLHKLEEQDTFKIYLVEEGENIRMVSEKLNVKVDNLMHWNNLKSTRLKKGQKLKYLKDLSD